MKTSNTETICLTYLILRTQKFQPKTTCSYQTNSK